MSAYIDLNAVRAGLVDDPKDYRWCGYAETLSARHDVCGNLLYIMRRGYGGTNDISLSQALEEYRVRLYLGNDGEKGFDREAAKKVLDLGGRLTEGELLRCRVKYFSAGAVIGEKQFVDNMIQTGQDYFGINRKSGAQKMRGGDWQNLCSGRNLQQDVIS